MHGPHGLGNEPYGLGNGQHGPYGLGVGLMFRVW